jgi:hypothetical protein
MKKLTQSDLSFLVDKELLQFCYGEHEIILNFSDDISLTVESQLHLKMKNGDQFQWNSGSRKQSNLESLINSKVISISLAPDNSLDIVFENNALATIKINENGFESYQITYHKKYYVV